MNEPFHESMITDELLAVISGESLEEYRANLEIRNRLNEKSKNYFNTPPDSWPAIIFNWDTSVGSQRFSLDGCRQAEFAQNYPAGFILGTVELLTFDKLLCHFSRRDEGELWEVGCTGKLAYLIAYLAEGKPISPPLVRPLNDRELVFSGGHHRYAIAKALNEKEFPFYVEPKDRAAISKLIPVRWNNA